jgi:hypothetical protein
MRNLFLAAAAAVVCAAPAVADPLGAWTVTSNSPAGPSTSTMTITQADGAHALTYESEVGPSTISDLSIDGDHVTFVRTLTVAAVGDIVFTYDITVDGDALTGTATPTGDAAAAAGLSAPIALEGSRK